MKTKPMKHQTEALKRLASAVEYYAIGAEQGTGKTWMLMADAERQHKDGLINGLLVVAPKGVHVNWIRREIPTHLEVPHEAEFWLSGGGKRHMAKLNKLFRCEDALAVLAINIDALNTKPGFEFARKFLRTFKCMMVIDESQRIKNPKAKRTKRVLALGELAQSRRIASGTMVTNSPVDLFSQFEFLRSGLLGTTSFRAFTAQYTELLPSHHPLVQEIMRKARRGSPQVARRDKDGAVVYRNLDKLHARIAPHMYRVLKRDCIDLPEKIYQTHYFDMLPAQRAVYNAIKKDQRFHREGGEIDIFTALTVINKLRQITSGFILVEGEPARLANSAPRLQALVDLVEDIDGPIIIWASFREELAQIAAAFKDRQPVTYHGGVSSADRELAVDSFQDGSARTFIANPAAGGVGLTLTAATNVIYYSNSYSLEERLQSEDRSHRIGTKHSVVYTDLVARDTIDERIATALQTKKLVAAELLDGDF